MARVVDEMPRHRRRRKYPWDEWLDGRTWELEPGVDFNGTPAAMRATILTQARREDVAVRTRIADDGRGPRLYIRAFPGKKYGARPAV
jgi:hypothetical protein